MQRCMKGGSSDWTELTALVDLWLQLDGKCNVEMESMSR